MRKLKLLFTAAALMLGVGGASAQQQDVTSTYLQNADFANGTAIDNNVCTYGKDMGTNGTTYYGAQSIEGWTNASVGEEDSGYANSKLAGALFEYGSTPWLAGSGFSAPATDPEGNAGKAAGLCAVWGGSIQYTQDVTLPAGSYTVRFKVYNATTNNGSGKFITTNLFGFVPNEGTAYYAPNKTFAIGQWSTVAVTFNLTEETAGKISMGFVGPGGGGNMPHLFVDNVKILKNTYYEDVTSKVGITQSDWGGTETSGNKVTTGDGRSINMIADYGQSSGRPMEQTITGLKKGTYEAVVFAYSQMEWKDQATWLNHDAGDVAYVAAEGAYTIKEWINARRGPGYPSDGPGIYCLSGIEVGEAGTLTLSINLDKADQTEWHGLQIHSLIYTKNLDLSGFIASYNTALSNAKTAAATTQKVYAKWVNELNTVIDTYDEGKVDMEDGDALEAATNALNAATAIVNKSIASYAIIAAGAIPDNSIDGWVCENEQGIHVNTWSSEGNSDGSNMKTPFIENWVGKGSFLGAGKVYYRLEGLEPGEVYYASALVRSYNEANSDAPNGPNFYINNVVTDLSTDGTTFTYNGMSGIYATLGGTATIGEDGILELGVVINEDRNYNWVAFKNVTMQEVGAAYNAAKDAADAVDQTAPMNAEVLTALQNAIALNPTTDQMVDAINALKTATANATASIANYAEAKTILDAVDKYDAAGQASFFGNEVVAAFKEGYDNRTLTAVTDEQKSTAAAALITACKLQTQPGNGCDMSPWIVNPGFNGNVDGWECDKTGEGWTANPYQSNEGGFMEYWMTSTVDNNAKTRYFDYHQTISNLPNGAYTITANLRNSTNGEENEAGHDGVNWNGGGNAGVYGKTESAEVISLVYDNSQTATPHTTNQIFVYNGKLTIGVKNIKPLTGRWFAADDFKLTYVRQLTDEDKNAVTSAYLAGSFNDWNTTDLELVKVGDTDSYACELDIEDFVDVTFKPVINGNWMDYTKFTIDAPDGWVENAGGDDKNIKLNNRTALYKTYTVTATWEPKLDVLEGWTLKIEGKDLRPKTTFTASYINNDWDEVHAYVWNGENKLNGEWPGNTISTNGTVTDASHTYDVYTYYYQDYEIPTGTKIIFNNGSGTQTADLDFVDGMMQVANGITFDPVYYVIGSNQAKTDKAIFSGNWDAANTTDEMTKVDDKWTISFPGVELTEPIIFKVIAKDYKEATAVKAWYPDGDDHVIDLNGDYDIVINFDGTNVTHSTKQLTEPFTISDAGWATAQTVHAVDFTGNEKIKAYTATVSGNVVTLNEVGAVPAGTPLVLKGETARVAIVDDAPAITDNNLKVEYGYKVNDAWAYCYGLVIRNEKATFVKIADGTIINNNKAFLEVLKSQNPDAHELYVVFAGDDTTGINTVNGENRVDGIYNINGQRVNAPTKGLYIMNGKKVVIK